MTTDPPGKTGLLAGADVVKYLTALGTGAIVFSAGLLSEKIFLSTAAKWFIFFSWCFLAVSVLGGLLAGTRIPVQLSKQNYNLEDPYLKWPGLAQQVAFFIGISFLGLGLTIILMGRVELQASKEDSIVAHPSPEPTSSPTLQPTPTPVLSPTPSTSPSQRQKRKRLRKKNIRRCLCPIVFTEHLFSPRAFLQPNQLAAATWTTMKNRKGRTLPAQPFNTSPLLLLILIIA